MRFSRASRSALSVALLGALPAGVLGGDIIGTNGFTTCVNDPAIKVSAMNIQYNRATSQITFDVAGTSSEAQNVTASMIVTAYGRQVYQKNFNPCDADTYYKQLCPVPAGSFAASGNQSVPAQYANMIPAIAFSVPDLDGQAKLELKNAQGEDMACIQSTVGNSKTMNLPVVSYIAAGIAASALVLTALGGAASSAHPGSSSPSPNFGEVLGWFQGIATNGMLSVSYPSVYQSFTQNFAFSTGLIPWGSMQTTIDNFRQSTGGNLTDDNYQYLQNVTIVETANGNSTGGSIFKRAASEVLFWSRDLSTSVNGTSVGDTSTASNSSSSDNRAMHYVSGIQAYVEQLSVPQANTFMTVLLIFAIVVAFITVVILLVKVVLEGLALTMKLPRSLESWRKRYWWRLAKTITNLVLILYGTWTLYCIYQFKSGDSWAAKVLAGITWGMFTALISFFTIKIWLKAREFKKMDGDSSRLFEDKSVWLKYNLFYDSFRKGYWWLFVPSIVYMVARNAVIAAADGHGMAQAVGQMIVEALFLGLLVFTRPHNLKSGNIINITIQVVRLLSVICVLVFVEELGISQTTKTVTGVVLIVMQSVLTGVLAILVAVNAIIACVKENPHRRARKDAEKMHRDLDNLTPLDARNSLLMDTTEYKGRQGDDMHKAPLVASSLHTTPSNVSNARYNPVPPRDNSPPGYRQNRPRLGVHHNDSSDRLVSGAASMGGRESPQPRLPDVGHGYAY